MTTQPLTFTLTNANITFQPFRTVARNYNQATVTMYVEDAIGDMSEQHDFATLLNLLAVEWMDSGEPLSGPILSRDACRMYVALLGERARIGLAAIERHKAVDGK